MAFGSLVDDARREAAPLAEQLRQSDVRLIAQLLAVDERGDWKIVLVSPELESEGRLGLARRVEFFMRHSAVPQGSLERVEIVGPEEWKYAQNRWLSWGAADTRAEPVVLTLWTDPSYRRVFEYGVEDEIRRGLEADGFAIEVESVAERRWRADLKVWRARNVAYVDIKQTHRRNVAARVREAAGLANIAGMPVVLVLLSDFPVPADALAVQGTVPVRAVDWSTEGYAGVARALEEVWRSAGPEARQ